MVRYRQCLGEISRNYTGMYRVTLVFNTLESKKEGRKDTNRRMEWFVMLLINMDGPDKV